MGQVQLNLSRKWRSKQFDTVIGQELSLRILQNSLYANQFFPVYLFSGQRGCGKTTTARIFAAALNCQALSEFQKNPKAHKIPCLMCDSCKAMTEQRHPDFIEIDAASHTGVDNVRYIIESASLLPVLGQKKIYLIDEAHMLSKAAFNAFLKILEEPPASVLFILATTDPHKIIETVRSRCFTIFFNAVSADIVVKHLLLVCKEEAIEAQESALYVIATETEGSVRDALNLLEQVRFSHTSVTVQAVLNLLGHMPEAALLAIFEEIIGNDIQNLLTALHHYEYQKYVALLVWKKSTDLVRTLLWIKQSIPYVTLFEDDNRVRQIAQKVSIEWIVSALQIMYRYESLLIKSTVSIKILEMLCIELWYSNKKKDELSAQSYKNIKTDQEQVVINPVQNMQSEVKEDDRWQRFIASIEKLSDPLLQSIFKQARSVLPKKDENIIKVYFSQEATFFKEWLIDTKSVWQKLLESIFGDAIELEAFFDQKEPVKPLAPKPQITTSVETKNNEVKTKHTNTSFNYNKKEIIVDISDSQKWKKAQQLQEAFGGVVIAIPEEEIDGKSGQ